MRQDCLNANSNCRSCGNCSMFESIYKPIDYRWIDYRELRLYPELKSKQGSLTQSTYLCEGSGIEYSFVPTALMFHAEELLLEIYKSITMSNDPTALCNEALCSSKIEGAHSTLSAACEIYNGRPLAKENLFSESMIKGGFEATKYLNVIGNKVTVDSLIKMWNILVDGCCDNQSIRGDEFRTGNVQVGNHVGLNYHYLDEAMSDWVDYYNSPILSDHPFIKACILHFSFEFIHPFCDGNGRAGRLLLNNFLIKEGFDKIKAISFSRAIERDKSAYYVALNSGDNVYTDCTGFIQYMLSIMLDAFYAVT